MILLVHSYGGANRDVVRHYPYWKRTGQFSRIIGVGTEDQLCTFPEGMEHITIGKSSYIETPALCRRLIDTAAWALSQKPWEQAVIIEYDTILLKPFPKLPVGLSGHLAGGRLPGCKASFFIHNPWVADRATWQRIVLAGLQMLAEGDTENNSPDCFIAWVCEKHGIPVNMRAFPSYSRNTLHFARPPNQGDFSVEARDAVRAGAVAVHGVKDSKTYHVDGMEMLRFITS